MKTKTRFHKLTAWLLTLAMLMTFISSFTFTAFAADGDGMVTDPFSDGESYTVTIAKNIDKGMVTTNKADMLETTSMHLSFLKM